jgi:antitoxin component YwqK of YwqJK toxin-antitoxin module
MKRLVIIFILFTAFLSLSGQSWEFEHTAKDTINMTDANGKKQGKWVTRFRYKKGVACKNSEQSAEEGLYKDNKRIGIWTEYHCNGKIKSKITYIDGKPNGLTTSYYENGSIKEEGTWINNRWVGNYKLIDENGTVTEKVFDEKGKEVSSKITPSKNSVPSKKSK